MKRLLWGFTGINLTAWSDSSGPNDWTEANGSNHLHSEVLQRYVWQRRTRLRRAEPSTGASTAHGELSGTTTAPLPQSAASLSNQCGRRKRHLTGCWIHRGFSLFAPRCLGNMRVLTWAPLTAKWFYRFFLSRLTFEPPSSYRGLS